MFTSSNNFKRLQNSFIPQRNHAMFTVFDETDNIHDRNIVVGKGLSRINYNIPDHNVDVNMALLLNSTSMSKSNITTQTASSINVSVLEINKRLRPVYLHATIDDNELGTYIEELKYTNEIPEHVRLISGKIIPNNNIAYAPYENPNDITYMSGIYNNWVVNYPINVGTNNQMKNCIMYYQVLSGLSYFDILDKYRSPMYLHSIITIHPELRVHEFAPILLGKLEISAMKERSVYHYAFILLCICILNNTMTSADVYQFCLTRRNESAPMEYSYGKMKYNEIVIEPNICISLAKNLILYLSIEHNAMHTVYLDALVPLFEHKLIYTSETFEILW